MAAIAWRYEFDSRDGVEWRVDIWDPNSAAVSPYEFTKGQGFNLDYESENNKTPFGGFIFSSAQIRIAANTSADLTELENIIAIDPEELIVIIYKDSSVYWRGTILTDLIEHENRSKGAIYAIPATDGLKRLQKVNNSSISTFSTNIIRGLVTILNETGPAAQMSASDTILKTANRWYENSMSATGTGVDPLTVTRFITGTSFWNAQEIQGEIVYTSYYDILEAFLITFQLRCFMGPDGAYHLIQNDQYAEGVLYLFSYPKNYSSGTVVPANFDPDVVNPNIEANGSFSYTPTLARTLAQIDIDKGGKIINQNQRNDWDTKRIIATLTRFDANTQIDFTFLSGPTLIWEYTGSESDLFLRALKADIEIKLELDASHYLTNKTGGLTWSTTSTDVYTVRVNNVSVFTRGGTKLITANASIPQISLTTPPLPTSGNFQMQITGDLIDPAGSVVSTGVALSDSIATITAEYKNPAVINGIARYEAENTGTESTYVIDKGDILVSDLINANYQNSLLVFNGSTYVYGSNWRRQATGTAYNIVTLGLRLMLEWQDKALQILNASIIDTDLTALSRVQLGSVKYVLNRASFNANLDTWNGSWIEFQSSNSGPAIGFEDPNEERQRNIVGSGKVARPSNQYFDNLENAALRITNTTAEVTGTITTINVADPGFDIDATGAQLIIVDPVTGATDTLDLNADFLNTNTSITVVSTTLSQTYPKGSYIYMPIGQVMQRIYNLENP